MAIVYCEQTWIGEKTEYQREFRETSLGVFVQERKHVIKFLFEVDDQLQSGQTILADALSAVPPLIPAIGEQYPDDPESILVSYAITKDNESANHGEIECTYETAID